MKLITFNDIKSLGITPQQSYEWIDFVLRNRDKFILPTKVRIPLEGSDYCNIMPCSMPEGKFFGLKVINRSEERREIGDLNLDSQILIYEYGTANLKAILDGNYITTIRTAAVAVHSIFNFAGDFETVAMVGLGNIGVAIGDIFFEMIKDRNITVKLYKYKDHAERFMARFAKYTNIKFVVVDTYEELMSDSDLVISSVTYAENDFCDPSVYKKGCTVIPVHMRGFMESDLAFDDILAGTVKARENKDDRVLIYNLGLAITDLYFASKIYQMIDKEESEDLKPTTNFYV